MLHNSQAHVFSVTFDGTICNFSMCTNLGANFEYGSNFKPYFTNPVTMKKCFVILDPCHMIKLVRSTLGDKRVLKTADNLVIKWEFIVKLYNLQQKEGLKAANKLTKKHIQCSNNRMNVKLAMQTLSRSVSKSLEFVTTLHDNTIKTEFNGCLPTSQYCLQFNNIMDMLNCKNRFSKSEYNTALTESNYSQLQEHAKQFENYINTLYDNTGTPILKSGRKTGFLGMIIGLRNMFPLYDELKNIGLTYLLTYKLSQDYLETFFSAIRTRGGFNNNPNALNFQNAYKRLLIRHEIKELENGNCLFDNIDILHVSSKNLKCPISDSSNFNELKMDFAHDYVKTFWDLSPFVENVVLYIAGYVCNKVKKK
ncbi:THAP domain-containing protein 9 [Trachymyrmex cornetzi]|uniref:THAP domain-containing protein 9 n=1 Tax=Trachymyrmex cornetzi TaxID=471704 RepID=A0A151J5Y0_9HYME|nr:THAP domain-containing protein 9 [Trachymyrmex cornetzi]